MSRDGPGAGPTGPNAGGGGGNWTFVEATDADGYPDLLSTISDNGASYVTAPETAENAEGNPVTGERRATIGSSISSWPLGGETLGDTVAVKGSVPDHPEIRGTASINDVDTFMPAYLDVDASEVGRGDSNEPTGDEPGDLRPDIGYNSGGGGDLGGLLDGLPIPELLPGIGPFGSKTTTLLALLLALAVISTATGG